MNTEIKTFLDNVAVLDIDDFTEKDQKSIKKYKDDTTVIVQEYEQALLNIDKNMNEFNSMMTLPDTAPKTEDLIILPDGEKRQLTQKFFTNTLSLKDVEPMYMYNLIDLIYYQIFVQYFNELTAKLKLFNESILAIEGEATKSQASFNTLKTNTNEIYELFNIYTILYNYLNNIKLNDLNRHVSPILINMISRIKFEYDFDTLIEKAFKLLNESSFNFTKTNYNKDLYLKAPSIQRLNIKGGITEAIKYEKKRITSKKETIQSETTAFNTIKTIAAGLFISNFPVNLQIDKTIFDELILEGIIAHKLRVIKTVNAAVVAAVDARKTDNARVGRPVNDGIETVRLITTQNTKKTANSTIDNSNVEIFKAVITFYLKKYLTPNPTAEYNNLNIAINNPVATYDNVSGAYDTFINNNANFTMISVDGTGTLATKCTRNQMIALHRLIKVMMTALVRSSITINELILSLTTSAPSVSMEEAYTQINKIVSDTATEEVAAIIGDVLFTGLPSHNSGRDDGPFTNYITELIKLKYDQMDIDMNSTVENIRSKQTKVENDKNGVDQIIERINYDIDTHKEYLLKQVKSIINMYYSQFITSINSLFISGNRLNKTKTKIFRTELKSYFKMISDLIERKDEAVLQYNIIQPKLSSTVKGLLEKYHKLFIDAIMYPYKFTSDNSLILERVNKLNEIIKGAKYNPDEDPDPVEDDIETTTPLIKLDGKTSVAEFDKIFEKFKGQPMNEATVNKILQELDKSVVSDEPIFAFINNEGCLGLNGNKCMELIIECLKGDDMCIKKFNELDLNQGIDISTISISKAQVIAKKIGFLDMEVDDWYTKIYLPKYKKELSAGLLKVFRAMKKKINIYNGKPPGCDKPVIEETRSPKMRIRYVASASGGMTGGGNKNNYNNFIINLTALKNNLSMSGGAGNSHSLFLDNLNYLKELLKANGKELDKKSENSIIEVIDKIQTYEKFLKKINHIITGFIYVLDKTDYKFDQSVTNPTITVLSDLLKKQELIQKKNNKRGQQLVGFYGSIPLPYLMPMLGSPS